MMHENLVGTYRRFGEFGTVYQVLATLPHDDQRVKIRILETGEETTYSSAQAVDDPTEH